MNPASDSMERIIPDLIDPNDKAAQFSLKLHEERYRFACRYLIPGRILDIACGTGYGTHMLSTCSGHECIGVDVSADAITYAAKRYSHPGISFIQEDILRFGDTQGFRNIVSLETIEHMHDPLQVVAHLNTLLMPGGQLIVSAPVTPSTDGNPYHVHDFTARSFRNLFIKNGFIEMACLEQKQPYSLLEVVRKKSSHSNNHKKGLINYYLSHPSKFFKRVSSLLADGFNNRYLVLVLRKSG